MKKTDFRKLSPEAQEAVRNKLVENVLNGMTRSKAADVFGVSEKIAGKWVKDFKKGGKTALKGGQRGRPKGDGKILLPWQAAQTAKAVIDRTPDVLKLPFFLWTREAVRELIYRRYGIEMAITTVGNYLRNWGFTAQKPMRRAIEQNPEAVRKWMSEEYPAIKKRAKKEKAAIFWGDETGLRSDANVGKSYSKKGKTPVIRKTGKRFGCNVISAITNFGELRFMIFEKGFTMDLFIRFLRQLIAGSERKIFLIVDGHPVHKGKKIKIWTEKYKEKIEVFYLPGYAPERNPDELLNHDLKLNVYGTKRPYTKRDLMRHTRSHLMRRQGEPAVVSNFFKEEHVRYAS